LANGIRDGWPSYVWWLALANGIRDGWPVVLWLMASEIDNQVVIDA
jgi:hypothetical protein